MTERTTSEFHDMSAKEQEAILLQHAAAYLEMAPQGGDRLLATLVAQMLQAQAHHLMLLGRLDWLAEEVSLLRRESVGICRD